MTLQFCLWPKQQSRNRVLGNHMFYSPTYLMLKRELLYVVLELHKSGCGLWKNNTKRKGDSKINEQIKLKLYIWITYHHQVLQSPTSNGCLKVIFNDQIEPQMVPKDSLRVSVRELHNSLVSDTNYGGLK